MKGAVLGIALYLIISAILDVIAHGVPAASVYASQHTHPTPPGDGRLASQ